MEHIHLWTSHVQLVQDVFLHTGSGSGCQSHHHHFGEFLTKFIQLLVVWTEVVAPLKKIIGLPLVVQAKAYNRLQLKK